MLFNSFSFVTFLPLAFVACGLMAHTPQGYRGGVRADSSPAAFGALDRIAFAEIPTATSLIFGFATVAFCRCGSPLLSPNTEYGVSRRLWKFASRLEGLSASSKLRFLWVERKRYINFCDSMPMRCMGVVA